MGKFLYKLVNIFFTNQSLLNLCCLLCCAAGILYQGCLIANGSMESLTQDKCRREITLRRPSPELLEQIRQLAGDAWVGEQPARNSLENVFLQGIQARLREQQSRSAEH